MINEKWVLRFDFERVLEFLITFFIIIGSNSIFATSQDHNYHLNRILMSFLFLNLLFVLPYWEIFKKDAKLINFSIFWLFFIMIYGVFSGGKLVLLVRSFGFIFLLVVLYFKKTFIKNRPRTFFKDYVRIISLLAFISLLFWILGSVLGMFSSTGSELIYWGKPITVRSYYNLYFEWQDDARFLGQKIFRNIGIFTEGPMLSLHLSVAYLFERFVIGNKSMRTFVFYMIATLSTFSITGILVLAISYFCDVILSSFVILFKKRVVNFIILLLPLFLIVMFYISFNLLNDKLASLSGSSRLEDYRNGFKAWMENPIFGEGFGNFRIRQSFMSAYRISRAESGFSNSIMALLSEGGIIFTSAFLIPVFLFFSKSIRGEKVGMLIYSSMFLFLIATTTFEHTPLMVTLLAIFYVYLFDEKSHYLDKSLFV